LGLPGLSAGQSVMAWWLDCAGVFDWDCLLPMVLKFSDFHITGAEMSRAKQSKLAY
jgi:hypothetical protein